MPRVVLPSLLILLATGAAGFLLGRLGAEATSPTDPAERPAASASRGPASDAYEPASAAPTPATPRLAGRALEPTVEETRTPKRPPGLIAGWVEVTVDAPPGWDPSAGVVYALPAGSPGSNELWQISHVLLRDAGAGPWRIPLPRAGAWDVGFSGPQGHALETDVRVAPGQVAPVRITFPGYASVRVVLQSEVPPSWPDGSRVRVDVREMSREAVRFRSYPGRGESSRCGASVSFDRPATRATGPLPPGRRYLVRALPVGPGRAGQYQQIADPDRGVRLVARPSKVAAGDTVEIAKRVRGRIDLHLRYEGAFPDTWRGHRTWLSFEAEVDGGLARGDGVNIGPGSRPSRTTVFSDPGMVSIRWHGWGVLPGALPPVELRAGGVMQAVAVIRIDSAYDPAHGPLAGEEIAPVRLRIRGVPDGEPGEVVVFGLGTGEEGAPEVACEREHLEGGRLEATDRIWPSVRRVHATLGFGWASRPTPVRPGRETEVELEPAGLVQVAPAVLAPRALGAVTLRRQDGEPFGSGYFDGDDLEPWANVSCAALAHPGMILGPLPVGEHVFEVWVGRVRHGTERVTVRAGEIAVLRILD